MPPSRPARAPRTPCPQPCSGEAPGAVDPGGHRHSGRRQQMPLRGRRGRGRRRSRRRRRSLLSHRPRKPRRCVRSGASGLSDRCGWRRHRLRPGDSTGGSTTRGEDFTWPPAGTSLWPDAICSWPRTEFWRKLRRSAGVAFAEPWPDSQQPLRLLSAQVEVLPVDWWYVNSFGTGPRPAPAVQSHRLAGRGAVALAGVFVGLAAHTTHASTATTNSGTVSVSSSGVSSTTGAGLSASPAPAASALPSHVRSGSS